MRFAVENDCGSRHSHAKTERIVSDVFDDFTQTIVPIDSYGLEDILVKGLFDEFNTLAEYDDDIKKVLKDLLDWYEECIDWYEQCINGKYQILDEPRVTNSQSRASVVKITAQTGNQKPCRLMNQKLMMGGR
ncbi:unnamed protein product [Arabis nemorensis]|uniref:Uncharacterized protein n=1 Tax=Arabis nemorensis TaxID=586526 RepID=A0A565CH74_9BRAS|nr:unnamed protein product [Arabis nemorensis]